MIAQYSLPKMFYLLRLMIRLRDEPSTLEYNALCRCVLASNDSERLHSFGFSGQHQDLVEQRFGGIQIDCHQMVSPLAV